MVFIQRTIIIAASGLFILLLGLHAGRGTRTFKDYVLANQSLGVGVLIMTFLATYMGGGSVTVIFDCVHARGVVALVPVVLNIIAGFLFMGGLLARRFNSNLHCLTAGELMGETYGAKARMISTALNLIYTVVLVSAQIMAIGKIASQYFSLSSQWAILIGGGIAICYTAIGGVRAVTATDILQQVAMVVGLSIAANVLIAKVGGGAALLRKLPADKLALWSKPDFKVASWQYVGTHFWPVFLLSPPLVQRMLMVKRAIQVRTMLWGSAAFMVPWALLTLSIGLSMIVLYPQSSHNHILATAVQQHFSPVMQTVLALCFIAVAMSTIDSFLLAAAVAFVHDLWEPLIKSTKEESIKLNFTKLVALVLGLLALGGALLAVNDEIIAKDISKLHAYAALFSGMLTAPLLASLLRLPVRHNYFGYAMSANMVAIVACMGYYRTINLVEVSKPCLLIIAGVGLLTSLLHIFVSTPKQVRRRYYRNWLTQCRTQWLVWWHPNTEGVVSNALQRVAEQTHTPRIALFFMANYMVPYFMWVACVKTYLTLVFCLKTLGTLLCVGLLLHNHWPKAYKKYFSGYWYFTITYCIPFATTLMYLLDGGTLLWGLNLVLMTFLLISLVPWSRFILTTLVGVSAALAVYRHHGQVPLADVLNGTIGYELAYGILFALLIGSLFVRVTVRRSLRTVRSLTVNARSVAHDLGNQVAILPGSARLFTGYLKHRTIRETHEGEEVHVLRMNDVVYKQLLDMAEDLSYSGEQVTRTVKLLMSTIRQDIAPDALHKHALKKIVEEAYHHLPQYLRDKTVLQLPEETNTQVYVIGDLFYHAIVLLVKYAHTHSSAQRITIIQNKTRRCIWVEDDGQGIPVEALADLFKLFDDSTRSRARGNLAFVQEIVHRCDGEVMLVRNKAVGDANTAFCITFPRIR